MALSSCYEQVATIHLINNVGDTENHSQIANIEFRDNRLSRSYHSV